ncbi:MAG: glycosyltransferase family 2 protein [Phycisphaerales bacterium JB039]
MPRLSVAIVCRNNERTIGRTLESVRGLADEIVAADSGSTDGTIGLLESAGARIIRSEWKGHIATKQMALEACGGEWVLSLDSDESPTAALRESIEAALREPGGRAGFEVNRKVFYRGRPLNHAWQPEWRLRLVQRGACRWAGLDPHDYLEPVEAGAQIGRLAGDLRHDSFETFVEHFNAQVAHGRTMARSLAATGARGSRVRLMTSPPTAFLKQLVLKSAWRDGTAGWLAASSAALGALAKHAALLELTRTASDEGAGEA